MRPLLTAEQRELMLANGQRSAAGIDNSDCRPVVKLFIPAGGATWLLTELDPEDPDIAFGLCDLGMGFPEIGSVRISELESVRDIFGLGVERDLHFRPARSISAYADEAYRLSRINA